MHISVIVPTLNEEIPLARTLEAAGAERRGGWIVADRGSEDWTRELAAGAGTRVTMSREAPLASGARAADGDVLLFLRAGEVLPARARARVRRAVQGGADGGTLGGGVAFVTRAAWQALEANGAPDEPDQLEPALRALGLAWVALAGEPPARPLRRALALASRGLAPFARWGREYALAVARAGAGLRR